MAEGSTHWDLALRRGLQSLDGVRGEEEGRDETVVHPIPCLPWRRTIERGAVAVRHGPANGLGGTPEKFGEAFGPGNEISGALGVFEVF